MLAMSPPELANASGKLRVPTPSAALVMMNIAVKEEIDEGAVVRRSSGVALIESKTQNNLNYTYAEKITFEL